MIILYLIYINNDYKFQNLFFETNGNNNSVDIVNQLNKLGLNGEVSFNFFHFIKNSTFYNKFKKQYLIQNNYITQDYLRLSVQTFIYSLSLNEYQMRFI